MNIQSKYIRIFTFILFFYGVVGLASAQVLTTNPSFPTLSSSLTITFDASLGNGGLDGFTGDVYAHTGVITDKSTSPADWKYVQGSWGTANAPKMTSIGGDKYTLTISDITAFYSVPNGEVVEQIAILFRNEAGNKVGRASDGGDMYIEVFSSGLFASIKTPEDNSTYSVGETVSISGESSVSASLRISLNGAEVKTGTGTTLEYSYTAATPGDYQAVVKASASGSDAYDTVNYVIVPTVTEEAFPTGNKLGINYKSSTSILLGLHAPYKSNVFVIGDFNDWKVNTSYFMKKDASNSIWWIEITGLEAGKKYAFQYLVDGEIKIADPFSELVLDPSNDKYIDAETYPNPHPYPTGKTTGIATLIEMDRSAFEWKTTGFSAPAENDLVVYELLVRDFVKKHNYATLLDTLDYLENLGVNAIELMPVNEFEGNNSWGYNPSFHMALDKYYGTPESFKRFVDECHKRGIAIILDVVYNHAFSQSPLCQLYWNATDFRPSSQSPYANEQAKHDFNVGYDLNHESPAIERFLKQVMEYWLTEYKVDGFRFDLSKGFTQNNTLGNVGAWGAYDTKRVENIKRIYDEVKAVNSDAYVILEHFSDNSEEKDLANYGCMFWGNLNHEATEGAMGYNSNFSGAYHGNRGWNNPKVLAFAESHDEERILYKNLQYGNTSGDYTVKDINTALDRSELTWVVFSSIPGPKMMWQFQELGYDYSIDFNGRTGEKPIKWEYNEASNRRDVYEVFSEMNKMKNTYEAFKGGDVGLDLGGKGKRVHLTHTDQSFVVLGNFDVTALDMVVDFQHTGMWYEYFSGDSVNVTDTKMSINIEAGEYNVWTDKRVKTDLSIGSVKELEDNINVYPNPATSTVVLDSERGVIEEYAVTDAMGRVVVKETLAVPSKKQSIDTREFTSGVYYIEMLINGKKHTTKFIRI